MKKVKVGIIGCGTISPVYLQNLTKRFEFIEVKAVVDLIKPRALAAAETWGIPTVYDTDEEMLTDPEIEIILNITTPQNHAALCIRTLEAGKHVYVEKPLSVLREEGLRIKELAAKKRLLAGGAPDTFLGGGIQTCRKLIDQGEIGEPIACTAFMMSRGPENWHPDPAFLYQAGAGPMFDMGPYYLTALVNLLGPIESVSGSTRTSFPQRIITSQQKYGEKINVEVPTHIAGIINFKNGVIGSMITSFDVWKSELPHIEIYGSEGTLSVPDPNTFGGPVRLFKPVMEAWREVPIEYGYTDNSRGMGIADMAAALRTGRKHRANVDLTYHVLDTMHAFHDACREGLTYRLASTCERPAPMPHGLPYGRIDE